MNMDTRTEGDVLVLRPREKRLDASVVASFKKDLERFVEDGRNRVVLDMEEVDFIDSTGLGAIVSAFKLVGTSGRVALSAPKETVMSLIRLTRIDKVLQVYPETNAAVEALSV